MFGRCEGARCGELQNVKRMSSSIEVVKHWLGVP
jgi:hypothetical protein